MPATHPSPGDTPSASRRFRLGLLTLVTLLTACHSRRAPNDAAPSPDPALASVEVDNRGFPDMTIYVLDGARRERLGVATGHAKSTFTIPAWLVTHPTTLKFLCDPIGGRALPVTEDIGVSPGDVVSLIILEH